MPEHDCGTCGVPGEWQCIRCPRRQPAVQATGPSEVWVAPLPRCPTHGGMHYDAKAYTWVCHGWDGEGCPHTVTDEQLVYERAGTTETPVTTITPDPHADPSWYQMPPGGYTTARLPLSAEALQRLQDMLDGHDG